MYIYAAIWQPNSISKHTELRQLRRPFVLRHGLVLASMKSYWKIMHRVWSGEVDKKRNGIQKTNTAEMETHPQWYVPGIRQAGLISFHKKKKTKTKKKCRKKTYINWGGTRKKTHQRCRSLSDSPQLPDNGSINLNCIICVVQKAETKKLSQWPKQNINID